MNIFEGSRRIAKAIGAVILVGSLIAAALNKPYVSFYYAYDQNDALQSIDECPSSMERFYPDVVGQPNAHATVCGFTSGPKEITLPIAELERIDKKLTERRLTDLRDNLSILAAVLLAGWALTWGIGWIVRGFMGIPRRQDTKS